MRIDNLLCLIFIGVWAAVMLILVIGTLEPPSPEMWGIPAGGITLIKVFMREDRNHAPRGD